MLTHSNGYHALDENELAEAEDSSSPHEVLEALSKLHQDLAEQQAVAEVPHCGTSRDGHGTGGRTFRAKCNCLRTGRAFGRHY